MTNRAAFIVEGHMEQKFIKKICPGRPVRRIECNGESVSPEAMAKRIDTLCKTFGGRYFPIVVWVDLEKRKCDVNSFRASLYQELESLGVRDEVMIGVADRSTEIWVLHDREKVLEVFPEISNPIPRQLEGKSGKGVMKRLLDTYHETTDGFDLLCACRASVMIKSDSFKSFYDLLYHLECPWLSR
ncbi:MAG: hypothetical protein RQ867_03605 [Mariprofundaceae bacterium]|nr:hypothetical protein [Mariprofundaceae bacterium]